MGTFAFWGTCIRSCHSNVDACFIQKDQVLRIKSAYLFLIDSALLLDLFCITFCRILGLFFRVSCMRTRVRCMLDLLAVTCHRSARALQSSLSVASGYCCTKAKSISYFDRSIRGGFPPPWGFGAQLPVWRKRMISSPTKRALTLKRCAS